MKIKMLVALLVTWRITGSTIVACDANTKPSLVLGICLSPVDITRSANFDSPGTADEWAKSLKAFKNDSIKVSDIHVYSEQGAK